MPQIYDRPCSGRVYPDKLYGIVGYLTTIPRPQMGSESIAHEAEG